MNDPRLTASDRHVALTLSIHMDLDGGSCFPSARLLAQECKRKPHTVLASVQHLEACGYLDVKRGVKKGAHGWSSDVNRYSAQLPLGTTAPVAPRGTAQLPLGAYELHKSYSSGAPDGALPLPETDWMAEA